MNNNFVIVIALFFTICFGFLTTSCTYYPRLTSIPLIKEKGDTRIEGGITFLPPNIHASVSHGATEKIAIQAAGTANGEDYYGHVAVGFYKNIKDTHVMELYSGFAYGYNNVHKQMRFVTDYVEYGNYQMYFTQFNFGNVEKKPANMESGFGLKLGYLHANLRVNSDISYNIPYPVNGIFVEPTGFFRFGGPKLRFHAALGGGRWFRFSQNDTDTFRWLINFEFGVSYSFCGISNSKLSKLNLNNQFKILRQ
jgi:hypothetical protein